MATEIVMPRLSDTMDAGTIAKWLKHEGDAVKRGDILAEIETDKANMELEAFEDGVLARILVPEGQSAALGAPIATLASNTDEVQQLKSAGSSVSAQQAPPAAQPQEPQQAPPAQPAEPQQATPASPNGNEEQATDVPTGRAPQQSSAPNGQSAPEAEPHGRIKASPLARRMAQEHNIDLAHVRGTGPGGRITKEDVQAFMRSTPSAPVQPQQAPAPVQPAQQPQAASTGRAPKPIEMTRMQQTIARRMVESKSSVPEFVLVSEVDMTDARAMLKSIASVEDAPKVGPNDFLVKAAATALSQHRDVNAGWENGQIVEYGRINVGFAVAIPGGLVVPVIHDTDQKTLGQIATHAKELIDKARNGKLAPFEYGNGTFSISNLGMFGIDQFTPIINPPEACILGVGAIMPKPIVIDGQIVIRDRMRLTLSVDHRVVYGAEAAGFLRTLKRLLENPMLVVL